MPAKHKISAFLLRYLKRFAIVHPHRSQFNAPTSAPTEVTSTRRRSLTFLLPSTKGQPMALKRPAREDVAHPANSRAINLLDLPPEIHLLISKQLIYPDALSLKHTSRYLYGLVDTGVELKIDWLVERRRLHLECPNDRRCDLRSDLRFCRGSVKYYPLAPPPFQAL